VNSPDKRRALRLLLDLPIAVESVGQPELELHPVLARIYQRVRAADQRRGEQLSCNLRDLSTNGAFIAGEPLPLLSRVALRFTLERLPIEAIGWILWRRSDDCVIPADGRPPVALPRGFGVLFEAIPFEARLLITKLVTLATRPPADEKERA
jgi:hypothetical protein